ncbi:DUF192 domain-containing protein [Gorillibacterium sp. sgz5001074]|uniref:DUF192 domain-containing protein n=1 Tax=Gorillibacterium sp. sgz5001074 TaxID=3446695 RepID=UPI003F663F07
MRLLIEENGRELAREVKPAYRFANRLRGLMGTAHLPPDSGLHLKPCRSVHTYFMRYAIDVLHLDLHNRIVGLEPDLKPGRIGRTFQGTASIVELAAGALYRAAPELGQTVRFEEEADIVR